MTRVFYSRRVSSRTWIHYRWLPPFVVVRSGPLRLTLTPVTVGLLLLASGWAIWFTRDIYGTLYDVGLAALRLWL